MANSKTAKKQMRERVARMRKLCEGCAKDPETCGRFRMRNHPDLCFWRESK